MRYPTVDDATHIVLKSLGRKLWRSVFSSMARFASQSNRDARRLGEF